METEDIDKILNKSYADLTVAERETIQEICSSEEEFVQLQQFFASVENYAQETQENIFPVQETKQKLDELFHETYQNKGILWYNSAWAVVYPADKRFDQRPLVRIAAILVLLISLVPLFNNPATDTPVLAHNENLIKEVSKDSAKGPLIEEETPKNETKAAVPVQPVEINNISSISESTVQGDVEAPHPLKSSTTGSTHVFGKDNMTYSWSIPPEKDFKHSDGIYMDTLPGIFQGKYSPAGTYQVDKNLAVLDLLTPTF